MASQSERKLTFYLGTTEPQLYMTFQKKLFNLKVVLRYLLVCIIASINLTAIFDVKADEDSNFQRIQLENNCSIELPVSWKVIRSGNQDLNEVSQSVRENIKGLFNGQLGGKIQTEFFAYKNNFKGSHASVVVQFNGGTDFTQKDVINLSSTDRNSLCDGIRDIGIKNLHPVSCTVSIMKLNEIYAIVSKSVDGKDYQTLNVQIPIGEKALALTFDTKAADLDDWNQIFLRIMNSVQIPH